MNYIHKIIRFFSTRLFKKKIGQGENNTQQCVSREYKSILCYLQDNVDEQLQILPANCSSDGKDVLENNQQSEPVGEGSYTSIMEDGKGNSRKMNVTRIGYVKGYSLWKASPAEC